MVVDRFPPVQRADEHGLLAIGGDLDIETLLLAYQSGIFPWPISDEYPLAWFSPNPRGILNVSDLHIPKSLLKSLKKSKLKITFNQNFDFIIEACKKAKNRKGQSGTWITEDLLEAYRNFHGAGFTYSVEVRNQNKEIVGGLYGVSIDRFIGGESMYHSETDASKIALVGLMLYLKTQGIHWMDTQMVTPVVSALGGKEIKRSNYINLLKSSLGEKSEIIKGFSDVFKISTLENDELIDLFQNHSESV
ncbi:MAG: leucyl/phenylalanyl-tRNA--protein transferase [Bacteriovoracaceae bacterium]